MFFAKGIIMFALCSVAMAYISSNVCTGHVVTNTYGAKSRACPVPSLYGNGLLGLTSTTVANPATVQDLTVDWFLDSNKNPALNVTFKALSQSSAQEYTISIMGASYIYPMYCGRISTLQPTGNDELQLQTISLEVTCSRLNIKPDATTFVTVNAKGNQAQTMERLNLPGCHDKTMKKSSYCIAEKKKEIRFTLQQKNNAVQVFLDAKTAFPKPSSRVYLTISKRDETEFGNWAPIGDIKTSGYLQRTVTFTDLEIGATYRVCVWRQDIPSSKRYAGVITLKPDRKMKPTFLQKLLRR